MGKEKPSEIRSRYLDFARLSRKLYRSICKLCGTWVNFIGNAQSNSRGPLIYSTVTLLARLRGLSTSLPRANEA
jgi:hypothetical protein